MLPAAPLLLGLALGMRHVLDADHLVAMSTIVTRERSIGRAALLGGAWGAGHSLSLFVIGLLVIGALAIAVLATIPSRAAALAYILLFGAGAIGGMMGITSLMALPARFGAGARLGASWISVVAALGSVVFGIFYLTVWA
ncbi:MAG TPA: hypothetical protein VL503_06605 [Candidatus Omnitrophota bacterium]|nr:hypothetical protein [Candidatus Omnitrophota bacterium]